MTDTQDAIAAFLAKGGKVQKVAENATCGMTNRDWYKAARDPRTIETDDDLANRSALEMQRAREANGYYKS